MFSKQLSKSVGETLGISTPFFRQIDARDGAECVMAGEKKINFASYDYLGLGGHPKVREAAVEAARDWGVSANASRLVGGERPYHRALESALAEAYGVESAICR